MSRLPFSNRLRRRIVLPMGASFHLQLPLVHQRSAARRVVMPVQSVRDKQKHKLAASPISFPPRRTACLSHARRYQSLADSPFSRIRSRENTRHERARTMSGGPRSASEKEADGGDGKSACEGTQERRTQTGNDTGEREREREETGTGGSEQKRLGDTTRGAA